MGFSDETYAAARKYTDDTVAGAGGLAGVPCQIQSITSITGGNRVTFLWIDNNGNEHTSTMNVMNGIDGEDGKGIQSVSVNAENHLIITYTDGTTADAGQIEIHSAVDSVNGQTGAVALDAEDVGALPDDTPIPSKTSDLTNDSGFITKAVNDLVSYYLKSETYSKTEVDDIVTALKNSRFEVVATLPTTDIKTNVIYLVPKSPSQTSNVKDEYINLDGTTAGWEKIGDTEIDLSDYVTTQALNTALADYTTTSDLTTLLAAKQDTLTFDNVPTENSNNPVKSGGVYAVNQTLTNQVKDMNNVYGAKNVLDLTTRLKKGFPTSSAIVSFSNEGIVLNGTVSSSGTVRICPAEDDNSFVLPQGTYVLSHKDGSSPSGTGITLRKNGTALTNNNRLANPYEFEANGTDYFTVLFHEDATTFNNAVVCPMICLKSFYELDTSFEPYAKTNQELTAENQTLMNNVDVLFETGVKNICPPYSGSFSANGITYTGNSDGTVTVNGTCSANVGVNIRVYLKAGQYKVSGCPRGGSYSTYRIGVTTDSWTLVGTHDHGNGTTITIPSDGYYRINLDVRAGYVANNLVFKPMITDVDTPESDYDHYVPYAKTNHQLTQDSVTWDNLSKVGAVNLLQNNATTQTINGVTFTVNSDGTIIANGANTSTSSFGYEIDAVGDNFVLPAGSYKLTGCPSNGGDKTWRLQAYKTDGTTVVAIDNGNGATFTLEEPTQLVVKIRIGGSAGSGTLTNLTFKPMITVPSYNGDYVPYAKSNKELTEDVTSLDAMYDGKAPSAVSDLNVPLTAGGASVAITRHLNNTTNAPTNGGGLEITWSSSDKYGAQLTLTDGGLYFRTNSGGTISAWQKIST